jgi:epoxide hydrolase
LREFTISVPQSALDDLHRRIDATRWPDEMPGAGWSRGAPLAYVKDLAGYWRTSYDWRAAEAEINSYPQFVTQAGGTNVHFLHVRSPVADAMPMIITHGWPGSFVEYLDVIGPLTNPAAHGGDPADAFHLVIPSIPGYAFSGPTGQQGWDTGKVALAWADLMGQLGYTRYIAQGGDWGSPISLRLGLADPEHCAGVHSNMCVTFPPDDPGAFAGLTENEMARLEFAGAFMQEGTGWSRIQSTRPQTLAYGLTDSPVGQLAWIAEKYKEWTDSDQAPEDAVSRDRLLTIVSIYWLTATAGSSAQIYYESSRFDADFARTWCGPWPLSMPAGVAYYAKDAVRPIKSWAEKIMPTLVQWSEFDRGGHFPALEQPDLFVSDLRDFRRLVRD